jgi:hypothetical protein
MTLKRSLGTCQIILISLTGILIIGWILTNENSQENSSKKTYLQYLTLSVQTNFRSLSDQLFNTTFLLLKRIHLHGQRHITTLDSQMLKRDYLGQVITVSTSELSKAFQATIKYAWCRDTKGPKDFLLNKQSLESNYDSHLYLIRGQGFLWYTVLKRAQIHANTLYICSKIAYLSYHQELQQ